VIGVLVAMLAGAPGPPPQKPRVPAAREDVVVTAQRVPEPLDDAAVFSSGW
jgi:hypothetical protein